MLESRDFFKITKTNPGTRVNDIRQNSFYHVQLGFWPLYAITEKAELQRTDAFAL